MNTYQLSEKPLSLYIHWPFCKSKCPYCDFNSHVREQVDQTAWHEALLRELRWYADQVRVRPLESIFFGGGTPSLMPPATVEALLQEAETLFGFTDGIEITLEANPTSVEVANFAALVRAGVNRFSLGVQSFEAEQLAFLGREHSADEAKQAIELAAKHAKRYSFDLIYALPGQTLTQWERQLQEALPLAGSHLSLYQLTIEPGTQFAHHHKAGRFVMPEETMAADFYHMTQRLMEQAGLPAYEVSNHAAVGEASRHNVNYWRGGEYIGIGPGAHGRIRTVDAERMATYHLRSPEKWLAQIQEKGHGQQEVAMLSPLEQMEESVLMGLRLCEGLSVDWLPSAYAAASFTEIWQPSYLEKLAAEGLIESDEGWRTLRPTMEGRLLLSSLTGALATQLSDGSSTTSASSMRS